jgi:hypothetical protein
MPWSGKLACITSRQSFVYVGISQKTLIYEKSHFSYFCLEKICGYMDNSLSLEKLRIIVVL